MNDYNYAVFDLAAEEPVFDAFPGHLPVGSAAPSLPLEDLATGATAGMAGLWRQHVLVMEFGSFT